MLGLRLLFQCYPPKASCSREPDHPSPSRAVPPETKGWGGLECVVQPCVSLTLRSRCRTIPSQSSNAIPHSYRSLTVRLPVDLPIPPVIDLPYHTVLSHQFGVSRQENIRHQIVLLESTVLEVSAREMTAFEVAAPVVPPRREPSSVFAAGDRISQQPIESIGGFHSKLACAESTTLY